MIDVIPGVIPTGLEVTNISGIRLRMPKLAEISAAEGLQLLTDPLEGDIKELEARLSTEPLTAQDRKRQRRARSELQRLNGARNYILGASDRLEDQWSYRNYVNENLAEEQDFFNTLIGDGRISTDPNELAENEYGVFPDEASLRAEFNQVARELLVFRRADVFIRRKEPPVVKSI